MFLLYAVQAAAYPEESTLSFEKEDGETEALRLSVHDTAPLALAALAQAHAARTTITVYADPAVKPPLWGHELYEGHAHPARCVARADSTGLTLADAFAAAAQADTSFRVDPCPALEPRWK